MSYQDYESLGFTDRKELKRQRRLRQWRQQRRDRCLAKMAAQITGSSSGSADNEGTDDELEHLNLLLASSEPLDETL